MKKKISYIYYAFLFVLLSCNNNYNLETKEGIDTMKQNVLKAFKTEKINSLTISTNSQIIPKVEPLFNSAIIEYYRDNNKYIQVLNPEGLQKPLEIQNQIDSIPVTFEISQIDFDVIFKNTKQAKNMIKQPELYSSMNLANWKFNYSENRKFTHRFEIVCNYKDNSNSFYTEVFEINSEGILKIIN